MKINILDRDSCLSEQRQKAFEDRVRFGLAGRITEVERLVLLISTLEARAENAFRAKFSVSLKNRRQVIVETELDETDAGFFHATDRLCRTVIRTLERSALASTPVKE